MQTTLIKSRVWLLVLVALAMGPDAQAQADHPLRLGELLPDVILRGITLPRPTNAELSHQAHFSPIEANELNNPAVGIVQGFNKLMMTQLSTFPLGSSAGGFTYAFDDVLGTFTRASRSFGPSFAERSMTIGRHRMSAGVTYQHTAYSSFEGQDLRNGATKFYLRHQECCSTGGGSGAGGGGGGSGSGPVERPNGTRLSPPFEGDLIEASLSLNATTDTVAFFGTYGVTSRWDIGLVVPLVRVDLDASVKATILRLATETTPLNHTFEAGNPQAIERTFQQGGSATGLGDVLVRTKYQRVQFAGGGLAGAVDLRLPTGDQADLLGAGTQVKMLAIASGALGRVVPHVNVGYTAAGGKISASGLLADVGVDDQGGGVLPQVGGLPAEDQLVGVLDVVACVAEVEQRPGVLGVVGLVEGELVRRREVPAAQEEGQARQADGADPAEERVLRPPARAIALGGRRDHAGTLTTRASWSPPLT